VEGIIRLAVLLQQVTVKRGGGRKTPSIIAFC